MLFRQIENPLIYDVLSFEKRKSKKKCQNGLTKDSEYTYCLLSVDFSYLFGKKSKKREYNREVSDKFFIIILVNAPRFKEVIF